MSKAKMAKKPSTGKNSLSPKSKATLYLCVLLLITLVLYGLGTSGMWLDARGLYKLKPWLPTTNIESWPTSIALGLDLRGGVYVEYQADKPEDSGTEFEYLLQGTMRVIQNRLTAKGYPESTVVKLGDDGIRVEIPDVSDPNAVLDLIGSPAKLEFRTPAGVTFMEGKDIKLAAAAVDQQTLGQYVVQLSMTDEGAAVFRETTAQYIGQKLSIYLDDTLLTDPIVQSVITDGNCVINGMQTQEQAVDIATKIQSGALPLVIHQQKVDTISATLGVDALSTSVLAAIVGFLLVVLLLVVRYRMLGAVASWALAIYLNLLFLVMGAMSGIQLTLPGIAGIILGIGMAVDANVVIFERIKELLKSGHSIKSGVRVGFKNALTAIIDSNVTTLIAAVVLSVFGTGSIQGFAVTLGLSVLMSMFTAIIVTRFLLNQCVALGLDNPKLYASVPKTAKEVA